MDGSCAKYYLACTRYVVNTSLKNTQTDLLGIGGSIWVCAYQPYYIDKRTETAGGSAAITAINSIRHYMIVLFLYR